MALSRSDEFITHRPKIDFTPAYVGSFFCASGIAMTITGVLAVASVFEVAIKAPKSATFWILLAVLAPGGLSLVALFNPTLLIGIPGAVVEAAKPDVPSSGDVSIVGLAVLGSAALGLVAQIRLWRIESKGEPRAASNTPGGQVDAGAGGTGDQLTNASRLCSGAAPE